MTENTILRILYMEDDPGLAVLMQKSLQRIGFHVDIASNGEDGLKMVEAARYDVLLIDYYMPVRGGIDVIRALALKGKFPPVIMVTGEGNEEVAVEALKLGAADYIVKDVDMKYLELLPAVISQVLYKQQLIDDGRRMEEAVRESEARYRKLVELSPDGISIHAGDKFVFINPAGARILGASHPGQIIGMSALDVVHPDFREMVKTRMEQLENEVDMVPWIEEKYVRLDGGVIDVEVAGIKFVYQGKHAVQRLFKDITERKRVEKRLEHLALYDTLTGLPNRMLFFDRMNQLLALARRNQYVLALLYMDLDNFKHINDTFGHEVGDLVLTETSKRMTSCTRTSDTVARMGGDEFIGICARIAAPGDAAVVARKIITAVARPFLTKGLELSMGVSIGISIYPLDGDDAETLLNKADAAMYKIKEGGKGGFRFFSDVTGAAPVSAP
ncbi:MAG: diguanylate cyclase [Nitrospirae bacterium]|nr:diguanylate cyclase [Nitrospirota bacterium]